jgi:ABC-type Fe3+-hydroxamate transport system substrate-binding protein
VIVVEEYEPEKGTAAAQVAGFAEREPLWREPRAYQSDNVHVLPRTRARITSLQSMTSVLDTLMPLLYPELFPRR